MGITSFYKIGGENNAPGYYDFAFIPHDHILYLPDPINGIINLNNVVLVDGAQFLSGYATINTLNLGDELKQTEHGGICPVDLSGSTPLVNNLNLHLFTQMAAQRFVILARDNNGRWYIGGEPNNGLVFTFKRKSSALDFSLTGQYGHICWEVQGDVLLDGSITETGKIVDCNCPETPGGPGEGGGIVTIKRADGTTITTIEAPAEYTVANTNAVLKDTAGATLSTTAIKPAGAAQNITAPDATITLKDTAGSTLDTIAAKSGESKNITAPNGEAQLVNSEAASIGDVPIKAGEAKEVVIPDTEITVKNSLNLSIENLEVPSCQPNEILVGDSIVVIKNTDDDILYDVEVAASAIELKVINDSTVEVRDSAGDLIVAKTVAAEKTTNTTIADSTVEITNTLNEVIATVNVKANGSTTQQIDDSNLTLNGAAWADVPAKSNKDFALVDENGATIPGVGSSTQIEVPINYNEFEIYFIRQSLINTGNY